MSLINIFFDKIFVLNLDERTDRWDGILADFEKLGIENFERFPAIRPDFADLLPSCYNRMNSRCIEDEKYLNSASGCKLSHVQILCEARSRGYKKILILEDDARFRENFETVFRAVIRELGEAPWDMLYFGWDHLKDSRDFSPHLKTFSRALTTHAYAMNYTIWDRIIRDAIQSGLEIDAYYAKEIHPGYNCFCCQPAVIYQAAGYSDILSKNVDYGI